MALFTVQQSSGDVQIVLVGGGGLDTVDEPQSIVHTDVHLYAKVPLVALAGLMHLGIASVLTVLGRARRVDEGGIDKGAFLEHQTGISQMAVDRIEDDLAQPAALQKVTKVEDRGLVGNTLGQTQPGKPAHRFNFIQRVFHRRIAQIVEQLQAMNAKHRRQRVWRPTGTSLVIMLAELLLQLLPGNQRIHLLQKHLATGLALLGGVFGLGKGQLRH